MKLNNTEAKRRSAMKGHGMGPDRALKRDEDRIVTSLQNREMRYLSPCWAASEYHGEDSSRWTTIPKSHNSEPPHSVASSPAGIHRASPPEHRYDEPSLTRADPADVDIIAASSLTPSAAGRFAKVFRAWRQSSGASPRPVAIKILKTELKRDLAQSLFQQEVAMLKRHGDLRAHQSVLEAELLHVGPVSPEETQLQRNEHRFLPCEGLYPEGSCPRHPRHPADGRGTPSLAARLGRQVRASPADESVQPDPAAGERLAQPGPCEEVRVLISRKIDDDLDPAETLSLQRHLQACPLCAGLAQRMQRTVRRVRDFAEHATPGPVLSQRILADLTAGRGAASEAVPPEPVGLGQTSVKQVH